MRALGGVGNVAMNSLFSSVEASWRNPVTRRQASASDACRVLLSEDHVSTLLRQALLQVYADTSEVTTAVNNIITYATLDKGGMTAPAPQKVFRPLKGRPGMLLVYAKLKGLAYCFSPCHKHPVELRATKDYCAKSKSSDPTSQHIMVCGIGESWWLCVECTAVTVTVHSLTHM